MEWYIILGIVLGIVGFILLLFVTYKTRIITNLKTLTDKEWNYKDVEAIADLFNIGIEALLGVLKMLGYNIKIPDLPDIPSG